MKITTAVLVAVAASAGLSGTGQSTFTNPLLPEGADPWVIYRDGYYYYMQTTQRDLRIWKTRSLADLKTATAKTVWRPPQTGQDCCDIWAPELHFLNGRWYIYFAADGGENDTHRLWVLENAAAEPTQGEWVFKGKITDGSDKWAIDPTVFENRGKSYLVWSGWEGKKNGEQDIFMARLKNPWTVEGERVEISRPQYPWEKVGDLPNSDPPHVDVNEAPEILEHGDKIFLLYSASGCWTDYYELGMLTADSQSNVLNASSWKKSDKPVFAEAPDRHVYGPGHNGFFKSPDGKQDWILYHATSKPGGGCANPDRRSPRMQPFTWNANGMPDFGKPVAAGVPVTRPSGETMR
ncbi:MAG: glycoside hydrolase family 43 protein [Acidobacteriaceae bacterium]|nr:glycoside hydrolase family 43 protein [Acidobacteriaceae bacterium]MBV9782033.1 glycoside hydrolase family 43 protein [Acidobacteriaceae bacterium]